jgi:diguanylate cyclase (GGDEF)-like protein/PAS domain S-box-containing protein
MFKEDSVYRSLFSNMLNGLAYCRLVYEGDKAVDFIYLMVNEAFYRQTGLPDVVGRRATEVTPGLVETDADLFELFGRVVATGKPECFERYVAALDMWFSISIYSPQAGHFVTIFDVITERKQAVEALLKSRSQLLRVIEGSDQGFWDWNLQTNAFTVSDRFFAMLGYDKDEIDVSPESWGTYIPAEDLQNAHDSIERHISGQSAVHEVEVRCRAKSDEWRWILTRGRIVEWSAHGVPEIMSGSFTDITERKKAEITLRQAATVFENTQEGVIITDAEMHILSVNRAFTHITGFESAEAIGKTPAMLQSGRHDMAFYRDLWQHIRSEGNWQGEICNRRKSGEIYPQVTTINAVLDDAGEVTHYVGVFTDVSLIKASEEHLEFLAHHDPLTRLPNRVMLFSRLEHRMEAIRREGGMLALLMIDLDRFKDVNESYGHLLGDQLLQQVSERLKSRLRGADSLVRLGGDEFTILLEGIEHPGDAGRVAGDVLTAFSGSWRLPNGAEVRVGASIGIALYPGPAETPEDLLRQADAALYRAKQEGRGRFHYFSEDLTRNARSRIELQNRLRHAIEGGELRVFFQPQVDIGSGLIVGAEALVRWEMPGEGLVSPDRFIPLAEETGLIVPLGRWVLQETCRIGRQWLDRGHPPMVLAVNVAAAQLRDSNFALEVLAALAETGYPSKMLELELTESSLMSGHEDVIFQLQTLRKHDIRVAIDDFGTGYSSLAYLKRFPLDVLKIDRSFVEHIGHRKDDREIVTAIIQMGHTLGFRVVAEGVETDEQLAYLKEKGCDVYQGFLKSHPLPADDFQAFAFRERR